MSVKVNLCVCEVYFDVCSQNNKLVGIMCQICYHLYASVGPKKLLFLETWPQIGLVGLDFLV